MTQRWLVVALLLLEVHFAASYLVPLDRASQKELGGLLRWAWPWADGDGGPLGQVTTSAGFPLAGLFLAMSAGGLLLLAALAVIGLWIPFAWWRALATTGAALSLALLMLFFGPTKLLPMALDLFVLYIALANPATVEGT